MTEKRRNEIAVLVMRDNLLSLGYHEHDAVGISNIARGFKGYSTDFLIEFITKVLGGKPMMNNRVDVTGEYAYKYLKDTIQGGQLRLTSSTLRRDIGNKAKGLRISEVQLTEFYRLLYIDVINEVLRQLEEEVPIHVP